ncbi:MAG: DUF4126 domain-containing protein [Acidobacteria bacterium]|nr:DUF4126 domain-containing protein [Acidobacteriota bacterium]
MERLAAFLALSLASGVNLYLAVLVAGLGQRLGWIQGLPGELSLLGHPAVLIVAGLLFLLEFLADKVPFVTPIWDAVHTVIRPLGSALLAVATVAQVPPTWQVLAGLAAGSLALGVHGTKMGFRILAHAAPDPAAHSAISVAEDLGVIALLWLAFKHPAVAVPLLLALVALLCWLLPRVLRGLRFLAAALLGRLRALFGPARRAGVSSGVEAELLLQDPGGASAVLPAFALEAKGAGRFRKGHLARLPAGWRFRHRRLFRTRWMDLGDTAPRVDQGLLWDRVIFPGAQIFLVTRNWSSHLG